MRPPARPAPARAPGPSTPRAGSRPRPARRSRPRRPGAGPARPASSASGGRRRTWTPRGTRRSPRPGARSRSRPVAAATSARVAAVMAFHSVSTFSSRAGWTRWARAAASRRRASSTSGGRASGAPTGRTGMERPSQFPPGVIPYHSAAGSTRGAGSSCAELVEREGGVRALDPAGVGVEGRVERALGRREVAQHEVEGLGDHAEIVVAPAVLPRVQIGPGQQGLVGEHLLEVGDEPVGVGGVAAEPADEMVVDAAGRHGVERAQGHVPGVRGVGAAPVGRGAGRARRGSAGGTSAPARSRPTRGRSPRRARRRPARGGPRASRSAAGRPGQAQRGPPPAPAAPTRGAVRALPASSCSDSARRSSRRTAPTSASACCEHLRPLADPGRRPAPATTRRNDGIPWRSTGGK